MASRIDGSSFLEFPTVQKRKRAEIIESDQLKSQVGQRIQSIFNKTTPISEQPRTARRSLFDGEEPQIRQSSDAPIAEKETPNQIKHSFGLNEMPSKSIRISSLRRSLFDGEEPQIRQSSDAPIAEKETPNQIKHSFGLNEMPSKSIRISSLRKSLFDGEEPQIRQSSDAPIAEKETHKKLKRPIPQEHDDRPAKAICIDFAALEANFNNTLPKQVPPTPCKTRNRHPNSQDISFPFKKVSAQAQEGKIQLNGQLVDLKLLSDKGSYMNVYTCSAENPIVLGCSNEMLVIKVFNPHKCLHFPDRKLKSWMTTSLHYFQETEKLGVAVAKIRNPDTALQDGCIIQDKMACPVRILHLPQARSFFETALKNPNILFDLHPNNLMLSEDGVVTLIDFPEERPLDFMDDSGHDLYIHALICWCKLYKNAMDANPKEIAGFLEQLTQGLDFLGHNPAWNELVLNSP